MSFGLHLNATIPEPSSEKRKELEENVRQTLEELGTVRVMFRELDKFLTVQVAGQLNPDERGEAEQDEEGEEEPAQ